MNAQPQTARAVIFNPEGKILLIERHKLGEHYFVLPGGHAEAGETPAQALIREVHEETGLTVKIEKLLRTETDGLGNRQHIYQCAYTGSDPALQPHSIEAKAMGDGDQAWFPGWFKLKDLQDERVYPAWLLDAF